MDLLLPARSPFTAAMARAAGISRHQLDRLSATGQVEQLLYGVYVATATPDSIGLRARAASLVLPEHAVVCDLSAAWLHGIDLLDLADHDAVPDLDSVSIDDHAGSRRKGIFGGKRSVLPDEVTYLEGVRVTTPIRTACDIARLHGRLRAIAALDAFRGRFGITEADLVAMLPRFARQRGVVQLRELVPLSTDLVDSQPESWIRLLIHDEGLPMPAAQVAVLVDEWGWVRMENAYEHLRIAVEYDGAQFHTAATDREHDRLRREALAAIGWTVIVVRKENLAANARSAWLRRLAREIQTRRTEAPVKRRYARGADRSAYRRTWMR
ncbi:DUF559 domain-containing protein [Nocardioides ginsengisoli]|uniref:DUF559 domain-containing protein n=1 Tax=Nocardioides ginsengisoli TaxID=363868 RepID=A0ABW3VW42_9ACTN